MGAGAAAERFRRRHVPLTALTGASQNLHAESFIFPKNTEPAMASWGCAAPDGQC